MPIYEPEPVPFGDGSNQELRDYLWREYLRISGTLGKYPFIQIEEQAAQPEKVQNGTILWADGTLFNPGAGAGFYGRRGDAWFKLDNDGGPATFTSLQVNNAGPNHIILRDIDNTGNAVSGGIRIEDSAGTRKQYIGDAGGSDSDLYLISDAGNIQLAPAAGSDKVILTRGQLQFPATQVASADPNTLDDYEEGTWTPTLTAATPGDLTVVYSTRTGIYRKVGDRVWINWVIVTSTFTHSTAAGAIRITGLPFTPAAGTFTGVADIGNAYTAAAGVNMVWTRVLSGNLELVSNNYAAGARGVPAITQFASGSTMVWIGQLEYLV